MAAMRDLEAAFQEVTMFEMMMLAQMDDPRFDRRTGAPALPPHVVVNLDRLSQEKVLSNNSPGSGKPRQQKTEGAVTLNGRHAEEYMVNAVNEIKTCRHFAVGTCRCGYACAFSHDHAFASAPPPGESQSRNRRSRRPRTQNHAKDDSDFPGEAGSSEDLMPKRIELRPHIAEWLTSRADPLLGCAA
mmetsp:Transcript_118320/g.339543  ORF Transcript_118320/g.339543 Transcript_118320/m.339543 type:complete len:187 (+) Transcript_118320:90-650(+)|eukprot:CAMPEP_0170284778 /NCGR_PEP_ID=MMETSP0116_2-20130129/42428_1 /TAXON_ID=400756 /ORGANISM="Durinskia baltica, Strain CSIRO CS-38" /LENGTH=186 /DNA_ID=CAMNT_0010536159 /DNA_START=88 /DNA_END=648 /DNA_ORIENTATION=-